MNELLDYLNEVAEEIVQLSDDLECDALENESIQLLSIAKGLFNKVSYYQGFAAQKDTKKTRTFTIDMTDDQLSDFLNFNRNRGLVLHEMEERD